MVDLAQSDEKPGVSLRIDGSYSIKADRETVWSGLQASDLLVSCIPGCEKLEATGDDTYDVVLTAGVASIKGTYTGRVALADKVPFESYKMLVEGSGSGGTVRGEAILSFAEVNGETEIRVVGDAHVTGVVARVGQRLLGSASKMLMNQFFGCVKEKIEGR